MLQKAYNFRGGVLLDTVYYEQKNVKLSCYNVKSLSEVPQFHSEFEMAVCFSGKVNCFLSGQNFNLVAGDIVLVFPNQAHNYKMIESGKFLVIIFYPEIIPNMTSYFKKICNYCIHNYRNKITLEILSKELHLSYPLVML